MTGLMFIGLISTCYILSYLIMHALGRLSRRYFTLRLILLPGVMVHELSHALACLVTGTPIASISFWTETGGSVVHHKPKYSIFTQPLISFAPFPLGIAALGGLSHYLSHDHLLISAILIFLMVSIAGTLAPSKTDFLSAFEGLAVLVIILTAAYFYFPNLFSGLTPFLSQFNQTILGIVIILLTIWLSLTVVHKTIQRVS